MKKEREKERKKDIDQKIANKKGGVKISPERNASSYGIVLNLKIYSWLITGDIFPKKGLFRYRQSNESNKRKTKFKPTELRLKTDAYIYIYIYIYIHECVCV